MSEQLPKGVATVAHLAGFDAVIDARAPGEFAEDRLPGALSMPVLDDEERTRVGTLYKQVSPLQARKVGAAMVARNVADLALFLDAMAGWCPFDPLTYDAPAGTKFFYNTPAYAFLKPLLEKAGK